MRSSAFAVTALFASLSTACLSTVTVTPDDEGCPGSLPSYGADCGEVGLACSYGAAGECGDGSSTATCTEQGWQTAAPRCSEPPPFECPIAVPERGSSCDEIGQRCEYEEVYGSCGEEWQVAECTGEGWQVSYESTWCSIGCPEELPIDGSDCTDWGEVQGCFYSETWACGDVQLTAACTEGQWKVEAPAACGSCDALGNAASCSANPACQWLVPGCGEEPLAMAGCFPIAACSNETCPEDTSCQLVTVDPCWDSFCNACGMEVEVCQPDMGGA
jgi:hypothetical protein